MTQVPRFTGFWGKKRKKNVPQQETKKSIDCKNVVNCLLGVPRRERYLLQHEYIKRVSMSRGRLTITQGWAIAWGFLLTTLEDFNLLFSSESANVKANIIRFSANSNPILKNI